MAGDVFADVDQIIYAQRNWGTDAIDAAKNALAQLAAIDYPYTMYGNLTPPELSAPKLVQPTPPGLLATANPPAVNPTFDMPDMPTRPDIILPNVPQINYPVVPDKPSITAPESLMGGITLGTLFDYLMPTVPLITLPTYDITPPVLIPINPAAAVFDIDGLVDSDRQALSTDEILKAIRKRILKNITIGGSGLSEAVETAIWNRNLERNEQTLADSTDKMAQLWAKKGFSLPDGMLAKSLADLQKDFMDKRIDLSREIAVNQGKLEQDNIFKSMDIGSGVVFKFAETMMNYDKMILQVEEDVAKFANEYVNLQIAANNSAIDIFKAKISAYEIAIRAEMAKVEVYRAEVEAALGVIQANDATVKIYATRIEAEIARYNGLLEGNKLLVQMFSEEIGAVVAEAGLEETKMKVYAETIHGLMAQVDIYKSEVDAMTAEIGAQKAKIDANLAVVEVWAKTVDAEVAAYNTKIEEYKANIQWNISSSEVINAINDVKARLWIGAVNANAEYAKLEQMSIQNKGNAELEAAKAVAVAAATLAGGAMSAVHASASMAYDESNDLSAPSGG